MHTIETINQFIELRVKGVSLSRIANQINVSQRTLVDWNRAHHAEIQELRLLAFEELKEKILLTREQELVTLNNHLERIEKELAQRNLRFIPVPALFRICAMLRSQIRQINLPPDPFSPFETEKPENLEKNAPRLQIEAPPPPQNPRETK